MKTQKTQTLCSVRNNIVYEEKYKVRFESISREIY